MGSVRSAGNGSIQKQSILKDYRLAIRWLHKQGIVPWASLKVNRDRMSIFSAYNPVVSEEGKGEMGFKLWLWLT